jgi:hypothetical protein
VVQDLREAVGWAASSTELDWASIEQAVGFRYPAEFRELCSTFPPGEFQSLLKVLHPSAGPDPAAHAEEVTGYAALLRDDAARRGLPYPIYPDPGGVVPWAIIGFDYVIGWLADAETPDAWPVIVCDSRAYAPATPARPRADHWLAGQEPAPPAEPVNAVADLQAVVTPGPRSAVDRVAVLTRLGKPLPPDFFRLVDALGAVSVGPAPVTSPTWGGHVEKVDTGGLPS